MPVQVPQRRVSGTMKLLWYYSVPLCVTGGTLRDGCSSLRGILLLGAASLESLLDGCVPLGGLASGGMAAGMRSTCWMGPLQSLGLWFTCPMVPWDWGLLSIGTLVHRYCCPPVRWPTSTQVSTWNAFHLERLPSGSVPPGTQSTWDESHVGRCPPACCQRACVPL